MRFFNKRKNKDKPFNILYRSNVVQLDEMGYPLRLCIVEGNGRKNSEQVWLDTLDEDGDLVLKWKETGSEIRIDTEKNFLDLVKKYFPDVSDKEADAILWDKTCFPMRTDEEEIERYLVEYKEELNNEG